MDFPMSREYLCRFTCLYRDIFVTLRVEVPI